jgi:hypothetical protein
MISFAKARRRPPLKPSSPPPYTLADSFAGRFKNTYRAAISSLRTAQNIRDIARAVRNKSIIGIDAVLPIYDPRLPESAARWANAAETFEARYRALILASGKKELARLGVEASFTLQNPYTPAWIQSQAGGLIREISQQTRQNIVQLTNSSFVDGLPPQQLAGLIRNEIGLLTREAAAVERRYESALSQGIPPAQAAAARDTYAAKLLDDRAERIARTETIAAEAQGQLASWRVARDQGFIVAGTRRTWISGPEELGVCPICSALDEVSVAINEPWQSAKGPIMAPPLHPNCLPGDALIATRGLVAGYSRRPYKGDVLSIGTARGHKLTCTPNHPILTPRGLVGAALLRIGDDVISSGRRDWATGIGQDNEQIPARIKNKARAFYLTPGASTASVPIAAENFHGDARDGDIAVIIADSFLRRNLDTGRLKQLDQAQLLRRAIAEASVFVGFSSFLVALGRLATNGVMGSLGPRGALLGGCSRHSHIHRRAAIAQIHALLAQASIYGRARNFEAGSKGFDRFAGKIEPLNRGNIERMPSAWRVDTSATQARVNEGFANAEQLFNLRGAVPGPIERDHIVSVNVEAASHEVFNLESDSGLYLAQGIVVGNCRCTAVLEPPED